MAIRGEVGLYDLGLAGRARELRIVRDCLDAAVGGQPRIVFILGEPGIGKTTLARASLDVATRRGMSTAIGVAVEDVGAPPYWPWTQVFRRLAREAGIADIAHDEGLAGELGAIAPGVFGSASAGTDRFAQFDAAARLLAAASSRRPIALFLDDAHWADDPSLLLLRHLARVIVDERLFIVVTARDTEPGARDVLAGIATTRLVTTLHLTGLDAGGVSAQLAALLSRSVGADEVSSVLRMTGGNPFLVREVGHQIEDRPLSAGDTAVTASVSAAVEGRLEKVGIRAVRLLEAAAVLGLEFRVETAAAMTGSSATHALSDLDILRTAGLVEFVDATASRFPHALLRDAVEARLETVRRISLHRAAIDAIEAQEGEYGATIFELARHWAAATVAGNRLPAAAAIETAARHAMGQLAFETAARLYRQALASGAGELDDETRIRLWLGAGEAAARAADHGGRFEACEHAAELARRVGRRDLLAEAALGMSTVGPDVWRTPARRLCEEALAAVDPKDLALRARLIAHHAETYLYSTELPDLEPATRVALEMAERSGDRLAVAATLRVRRFVLAGPVHLADRSNLAAVMLEEGRRLNLPGLELQGHLARVDVELERGNLAGAAVAIEAVGAAAAIMREPQARFAELTARAVVAFASGRFEDCRTFVASAFAALAAGGDRNPFLLRAAVLGNLSHHAGVDAATLTAIQESHAPVSGEDGGLIAAVSEACVLAQAGRLNEAEMLYAQLGPVESWRPPPHVELLASALGVSAAQRLGRPADAAILRRRLLPFRDHHVVCGTGAVAYFGPVELWTGVAAKAAGLIDDSVRDLEAAVERSRAAGTPGFEAEAKIELAGALLLRGGPGDAGRARGLVRFAAQAAARMNARALEERAAAVAAGLGRDPARLTRREEEVARMVAEGLSNGAIGERLFLSERTVQNHVQHVLNKLDVANRAQIAAWVVRRNEHIPE